MVFWAAWYAGQALLGNYKGEEDCKAGVSVLDYFVGILWVASL